MEVALPPPYPILLMLECRFGYRSNKPTHEIDWRHPPNQSSSSLSPGTPVTSLVPSLGPIGRESGG